MFHCKFLTPIQTHGFNVTLIDPSYQYILSENIPDFKFAFNQTWTCNTYMLMIACSGMALVLA